MPDYGVNSMTVLPDSASTRKPQRKPKREKIDQKSLKKKKEEQADSQQLEAA